MSANDEHIARIKALLNDKAMIARLPDGGDKLRERLRSLMTVTSPSQQQQQQQQQDDSNAMRVIPPSSQNTSGGSRGAFGNSASAHNDAEDRKISKNGTTIIKNQNEQHHHDRDINSRTAHDKDNDTLVTSSASTPQISILQKAMLKNFGDGRLGHLELIRLCKGISSEEARNVLAIAAQRRNESNSTSSADRDDKDNDSNQMPTNTLSSYSSSSSAFLLTSATTATGLVDAKPLQILDFDETTAAHYDMLEQERQEELKKIRQRMELFCNE